MELRCFVVCVDYSDYWRHAVAYNRHHFKEYHVITAERDTKTIELARANDCSVFCTNAFWEDGAAFNKFKSLEQGLDHFGRHGILVLMDADTLWPKTIPQQWVVQRGEIHTPFRRMHPGFDGKHTPTEDQWLRYPRHHFQLQWTGYTQVFHGDDPHLGSAPWHEINWRHAGGGDSVFQTKWPAERKIRPPFEVLHLGPSEHNWGGRASNYLDGTHNPHGRQRLMNTKQMLAERHRRKQRKEQDVYAHEKIEPNQAS